MITKIQYNWHQTSDGNEIGEDYGWAEVGNVHQGLKLKVVYIAEHAPDDKDCRWYYTIVFEDKKTLKVFNPNMVLDDPAK